MIEPVTAFASSLGSAVGKNDVSQATRTLRDLLEIQDAELELLRAVDVKVDAIVAGPFHTGCRQLDNALAAWRKPADREHLLRSAHTSFSQALGRDGEPMRRALAALHLACVWLALDSPEDVRGSLWEAHFEALRAIVAALDSPVQTTGVLEKAQEMGWRAVENFMGKMLGGTEALKNQEAGAKLVPFANALAETRRAWGTPPANSPIVPLYPFRGTMADALAAVRQPRPGTSSML